MMTQMNNLFRAWASYPSKLPPILILVFLLFPPVAWADIDPAVREEARRFLKAGNQYYRTSQFQQAIEAYSEVMKRVPHPDVAFNLGQCYMQLEGVENLKKAIFYYKYYLSLYGKEHPDEQPPRDIEVKGYIAQLERAIQDTELAAKPAPTVVPQSPPPIKMAQLRLVGVPSGARVLIDGILRGVGPILALFEVEPGLRTIRVEAEGYEPWVNDIRASEGHEALVTVRLVPLPGRSPVWLGLGISTAVLSVVSLSVGIVGTIKHNEAKENSQEWADWGNASVACYATAGVLAAGSLASWLVYGLTGQPKAPPKTDVTWRPTLMPGKSGALLSIGTEF